jgi:hypothetical protein
VSDFFPRVAQPASGTIAAAATSKMSERESFSMGTSLAWAPGEAKHGMDGESLAFAER